MPIENKLGLDWSAAEKALGEGTFSGYKMGILETEKLLERLLKDKKVPGANTENKIKYIKRFLSLPDKLAYGRHIYERVIAEPHFEISREETKQVINGYWQAMIDIEETVESLGRWQKISLRLKYFLGIALNKLRVGGVIFFGLIFLIWLLGETSWGKSFSRTLVTINHFFIFKILYWTAIVIGGILLLGLILYIIRGKRRF